MTAESNSSQGRISISPTAIASIASHSAMESYGIVGMAAKNFVDGLTHAIAHDPRHGVEVRQLGGQLIIDL